MKRIPPTVVAIITGERGHREIVRPLAAVGIPCAVLDLDELRSHRGPDRPRFIPQLWQLIRAYHGAIIFTDLSSVFLAAILAFAKLHGSPVLLRLRGDPVAETHDQLRFHWQQRQWSKLLRSVVSWALDRPLFRVVDHFVPVSHWIVRRLRIGLQATVVRIPVPLDQFPLREHQPVQTLRLLAVTNFNYPQKIAAMGRFLENFGGFLQQNQIAVTVAGTGIAWESFAQRHQSHAQFPGFVQDVASLYSRHDVFVHFSDLDAFPYVVLEAQAVGLPVLVNRDCGMIEQVEDGENGCFVDLEDRPALEALLLRLRDSVEFRTELGTRARQTVAERYSLTAIGAALIEPLESIRFL